MKFRIDKDSITGNILVKTEQSPSSMIAELMTNYPTMNEYEEEEWLKKKKKRTTPTK